MWENLGMRVSKTGLEKFKKLYTERFKENLSEIDALRKAQGLLDIWEAIQGNPLAEKVDREEPKLLVNKEQHEHTK